MLNTKPMRPIVWMQRNSVTGFIMTTLFDPYCTQDNHPFITHRNDPQPNDEVLIFQLWDMPELRHYVYKNFRDAGDSFMFQILGGIWLGIIEIEIGGDPLLSKEEAPCLYIEEVKIAKFKFSTPEEDEDQFVSWKTTHDQFVKIERILLNK